ncbi:exonuclease DPD1, chloroplastic/mitochondrial-like [Aegilops tauschii subsp. strangulata]|uniref:DNA polymerase III subunit epsilon n=1 Tax=Aegilops tauschii TaxID=37682 RepID=M8BLA3_AEGTA|nr:exonuclease DPD1, chloroplastic/mitochondrial-like [Triticum aestivum]
MALLLRFNQLRNSIWSSCPARLLMPHAGLSSGKLLDPKSYERRLFSTRVQETASLDRTCISRIQPLEFQQTSEHEQSVPLLIFDIKTTGFFQKRNRITEFAVHDLWAGKNNTFETLLNPEMDVPKYVAAVTNINNDLVCRPDVPRFSDVLPLLLAFVRSCQTPGKPIIWVAHNVKRFDGPFLAQKFDRCSAQMPEDWLFVDTLCLATKLPKLSASNDKRHLHDLESLCKRYGISVEGPPHRAMQEVMKLCQVFQKMSFDLKLTYEGLIDEAIKANYFSKFLN